MVSQTNEQALEAAIEKHLTGTCLEEIKKAEGYTPNPQLYQIGLASNFNTQYAIDEKIFWAFLQSTQKKRT